MDTNNLLKEISKEEEIFPRGWKIIELNYLHILLSSHDSGDILIVGERGSEDGVLATVLHNKSISRPVHCIDIQPLGDIPANEHLHLDFGQRKIKEGEMKFFHSDIVTWDSPKNYDFIACINVLEHFGFDNNGDYIKENYDFQGFEKMLSICNKSAIFTMPYDPFSISDDIQVGGRIYSEFRISVLISIARIYGFTVTMKKAFINLQKSSNFKDMPEYSMPSLYHTKDNHEYLILLIFNRMMG